MELPKRRPHERPGADPRGSPDRRHGGEAEPAELDREARLPQRTLALRRRARLGADDAVEGRGDEPVVLLRRLDGHGRRHGAQEVDEGGVGAVAHEAVLRLLRDVEAGRVAQLDDAVERLEGDAHPLDQLRRAPADVAEKGAQHLDPEQRAAASALVPLRRRRVRRAAQRDARGERGEGRSAARRPHALFRQVGGDPAVRLGDARARVHAGDRGGGRVEAVGIVEVRVEQRVRVRRLLLQQRPVVANRPEEGAQRVALRAALLRVVDLAVGIGGERVALAAHAREEAPLARVPEPRGGDQLGEPAAEAREDGPAPDGVEAVLLVV